MPSPFADSSPNVGACLPLVSPAAPLGSALSGTLSGALSAPTSSPLSNLLPDVMPNCMTGLMPSLMVAGVRSGCGKTTLTLALLAALRARNIRVLGCKAGPDFIDPAHHSALTGEPSYNLDAWMGGDHGLERAYTAAVQHLHALPPLPNAPTHMPKMLVVEGVMGLFDGASCATLVGEGAGSSAQVARRCKLPVLLVVDVRGMAQSVAPVVQGFLHYRTDISFAGIVCTHVGGPRHQKMLREALDHVDTPLVALLPRAGAPVLPSRHLGLCMPHEVTTHAATLATWLEDHADLDALLSTLRTLYPASVTQERSQSCVTLSVETNAALGTETAPELRPHMDTNMGTEAGEDFVAHIRRAPVIAIARDNAFCFLYPDFAPMLHSLGAHTVCFSPLEDTTLPPCDAVYIPGGYPELFAPQLTANVSMRVSILDHAKRGGTIYGECGGYMYMMRSITTATGTWPMTNCFPLDCRMEEKRVALGYRSAIPVGPASQNFWGTTSPVRGHEYHYARILPSQETLPPLWQVSDAAGTPLPPEGSHVGRLAGSWLHLYPQGARDILQHFVQGLLL